MKKRGKIIRDTSAGPGLLIAEGQQYPFQLEGAWRSEEPPRTGMVVDVELNERGDVVGITALPESQLAKEQAEVAMAAAKERGAALASGAVAKFGIPSLTAGAALIIGWWMLPAVSLSMFGNSVHITFWQILGFINTGNPMTSFGGGGSSSTGIYGLIAIIALVGPFVHHFWKDKRAILGSLLPLVFMLLMGYMVLHKLDGVMGGGSSGPMGEIADQVSDAAWKAISIGAGIYLSMIASIYFAFTGTVKFLASKATGSSTYNKPQKMTA